MCGKKSRSSLTCMCKSNRLCFINSALRPCFVAKCFKGGQASVMKFTLDMPEQIARARSDLRMGVPIVLQTAEHSMLAIAVETLDEARLVHAALPMQASTAGRVHVFRPDDGAEEHYAIEIGRVDRSAPVLTRLHSACFTGDVLGSMKCDCGPQLHAAMAQMGTQGAGILLYLNQEGRGIGLANKMARPFCASWASRLSVC